MSSMTQPPTVLKCSQFWRPSCYRNQFRHKRMDDATNNEFRNPIYAQEADMDDDMTEEALPFHSSRVRPCQVLLLN